MIPLYIGSMSLIFPPHVYHNDYTPSTTLPYPSLPGYKVRVPAPLYNCVVIASCFLIRPGVKRGYGLSRKKALCFLLELEQGVRKANWISTCEGQQGRIQWPQVVEPAGYPDKDSLS